MGPTWGSPGATWTQVGPMLAPWTLLSGMTNISYFEGHLHMLDFLVCDKLCAIDGTELFDPWEMQF